MDAKIAVIIPFYQREHGLLARALRSVLRQQSVPPIVAVVVDDGSPLSAQDEMRAVSFTDSVMVHTVVQHNQGIGPARNAGLAAVPDSVEWIAHLDSDDEWAEFHLAHALHALELGYDFFFADQAPAGGGGGIFARSGIRIDEHPMIDEGRGIHRFVGNMFDQVLQRNVVSPSSVVIRRSRLGSLRFQPYRGLFDDLMFWLQVTQATSAIVFSPRLHVIQGEGVSESRADDWRTNKALRFNFDELRFYTRVRQEFRLSPVQRDAIDSRIRTSRQRIALTAMAMLAARNPLDWQLVRTTLANYPRVLGSVPTVLARELLRHAVPGRLHRSGNAQQRLGPEQ